MRHRPLLGLAAAALALTATGCGTTSASTATQASPTATHATGMAHDQGQGAGGPSETASMVCGNEIRGAVRRNLGLSHDPVGHATWKSQLFTCTYPFRGGDLTLSVKDLHTQRPGRRYFDHLRATLRGAAVIKGLASFGFPAFETPAGDVVFIKDHKTLWVDATHLAASTLPKDAGRQDVAYGIAAAVIGCWTE